MDKEVLHKYVVGRCTIKEEEMVEQWIKESPDNKKMMEEFRHILEVSPGKRIEVNTYKAWNAFSEQYFPYEASPKVNQLGARSQNKSAFQGSRYQRTRNPRVLVYGLVAAAVIMLTLLFYYGSGFYTTDVQPKLVNQEITTEKGQRTTIRLSDGTRIHLNAESRLIVDGDFNSAKKRIVHLEGEALFEVASDKQRPFEVQTDRSVTRVLGTKFNVTAYPEEEEVQVVVSEGKVMLGSSGTAQSPEVKLIRKQKGMVDSRGEVIASKISDLDIYLDWSRGRLTFRDASVQEMARRLERWFNIKVIIDEGVSTQNRSLTGSFKDVPLSSVLHSIALSLDMDYRQEGRTIIFEDQS